MSEIVSLQGSQQCFMKCGTFCFVVLFCSFLDMFGKCEATDEGEMLKKKKKKAFPGSGGNVLFWTEPG